MFEAIKRLFSRKPAAPKLDPEVELANLVKQRQDFLLGEVGKMTSKLEAKLPANVQVPLAEGLWQPAKIVEIETALTNLTNYLLKVPPLLSEIGLGDVGEGVVHLCSAMYRYRDEMRQIHQDMKLNEKSLVLNPEETPVIKAFNLVHREIRSLKSALLLRTVGAQ
jgi:hypothetical protein